MKTVKLIQIKFAAITALAVSMLSLSSAHAMIGSKLDLESLSAEESEKVQEFINTEVRADFTANLNERLATLAAKPEVDAPMSKETEAVLLKGAFLTLQNLVRVPISETKFNQVVGRVMEEFRSRSLIPHALTLGTLSRGSMNVGPTLLTMGGNFGAEVNFYLQGGKLMMTNYALLGGQLGVGTPVLESEYYVGFCFGACFGGDPRGFYFGVDISGQSGAGGDVFIEAGVDVSSILKQKFVDKKKFSVRDIYESSTVYIGGSFSFGFGLQVSSGLYHYSQIGRDMVLANPSEALNPSMISSHASDLKP